MAGILDRFRVTPVVQAPEPGQQQQQNQNGNEPDAPEEDESPLSALAEIYKEPPEEDQVDEDEPEVTPKVGPDGKPLKSEEQTIAEKVQAMIQGITIAEDAVPEGFDPSDPKQFRDVMAKIAQNQAMTTMAIMMEPIKAAMKGLSADIRAEIQTSIQSFGGGQQSKQILEQHVPEVKNPELTGLVNTLFEQAKKRFPKDTVKAAAATRKSLDALMPNRQKDESSDPSEGGFKSGASALDAFAPLPKRA